jgi:hypothetical protein
MPWGPKTSQEAMKESNRLTILPNPTAAEAIVRFRTDGNIKSPELRVIDMAGKLIYRNSIQSSNGWTILNSSVFANGVYLVEVISGNNLLGRERWIVNH